VCVITSKAQDLKSITVSKSEIVKEEAFKVNYGGLYQTVLEVSDNNGGFVTVRMIAGGRPIQKPKAYKIYHYGKDLKLISETEYQIKRSFASLEGALVSEGEIKLIHLTVSKVNKKNCDINLVSAKLDSNEFTSKVLFSASKKEMGIRVGTKPFSPVRSFYSPNKKFYLVSIPLKRKKEVFIRNVVFDKALNLVSDNIFKCGKDGGGAHLTSELDTNGVVYSLIGEASKGKKNKQSYTLLKSTKQGVIESTFSPDKFLSVPSIALQKDKVIVLGMASDKEGEQTGIQASFFDLKTLKNLKSIYHGFSEQYLKDKFRKIKKNYKSKNLKDYNRVFVDSKDNIHFLAQELYIVKTGSPTNPLIISDEYTYYDYEDVIYVNLNADGSLNTMRNIKNKWATANFTFYKDNIYIFLKGSNRIKEGIVNASTKFGDSKKLNLFAVNVSNTGQIKSKKIINLKSLELGIKQNEIIETLDKNKGAYLLSTQKGARNQYVEISLD